MKDKAIFFRPSFEQLPIEILDSIFRLCGQTDIYALLTVSSKIFPVAAKKIWNAHTITREFGHLETDFRKRLFFQTCEHRQEPIVNPKLPYLDYITELTFDEEVKPEYISLLKKIKNCKTLTTRWSPKIGSALLDSTHVVPFLSKLTIHFLPAGCRVLGGTQVIKQILENRAESLDTLNLETAPFCLYGILHTVVCKTKITHFSSNPDAFIFNKEKDATSNEHSVLPLSASPFLQEFSFSLHQLLIKPNVDFFNWMHTSPYLTKLSVDSSRLRLLQKNLDPTYAFLYFLRTFPAFSSLKHLNLNFFLSDSNLNLIPVSIVPSTHVNFTLESLTVHFSSSCDRRFYETLICLLKFFVNLKHLSIHFSYTFYGERIDFRRNAPLQLEQFFSALMSLNLVKLELALPNKLQRLTLPILKNMTSLREIDLLLDTGLLYQFIPQLKQITRFTYRSFGYDKLVVAVDGQALDLEEGRDAYGSFFVFKKNQLDLLRSTFLGRVSFKSSRA